MPKISYRVLTLLEAGGLVAYIAWYIWQLQAEKPKSWIVFAVWLALSIILHRDTPKTLGWRADNLWPAIRQGLLVFSVFLAGVFAAAGFFDAYHRMPIHFAHFRQFWRYAAFCLLQQVALNSYLSNRLQYVFEKSWVTALLAAATFAGLHWPNPVLVPLTFIGGLAMSWLFIRERNILPLAIGQALLGALVWWAFPVAWHHGMRVGPGYYSYHSQGPQ